MPTMWEIYIYSIKDYLAQRPNCRYTTGDTNAILLWPVGRYRVKIQ